jgi:putative FmdB family regulatory protein
MPIYEYECDKCGQHLEVLQRMDEKPLSRCTSCRGKVRKVVSRSSFQLKGSGWYVTDYARKASGDSNAKSEPGKSESKKTESTKTESKKTESKPAAADA